MGNTKDKLTLLDLRTEGDGSSVFGSDLLGGLYRQLIAHSLVGSRWYIPFCMNVLMSNVKFDAQQQGRSGNEITTEFSGIKGNGNVAVGAVGCRRVLRTWHFEG